MDNIIYANVRKEFWSFQEHYQRDLESRNW